MLTIFPGQLHIGDRFVDADIGDEDKEWEVASLPVTFKKGHEVRARSTAWRSGHRPREVLGCSLEAHGAA